MGDLLIADGILTERMHTIYYLTHEYDPENAQYNRARELPDKVRVHMQTRCTGIQADGVTVVGPDGVEQKIAADTVILAAGMRAKTEVYERFIGVAHDVINVGDSKKASTVYNAITTGFDAGTVIL